MSYCPSCNELRETIIKPVEAEKKYAQHCSKCGLQIFFPDAITRMQFLKCKEETTYKKYVYYPLLGLFIVFLGMPLLSVVARNTKGASSFFGGLFCLIGIPILITKLVVNNLAEKYKRLISYSSTLSKSFFKGAVFGAFCGYIAYSVLVGFGATSLISNLFGYLVGIIVCTIIMRNEFLNLKFLFEVLDEELYSRLKFINEDLKSDSNNNTENEFNENFSTNEIDEEEIISDCYNVFNLTPEATEAEIKTAYKAMIKKFHPDKFEHLKKEFPQEYERATEMSKKINLAYNYILKRKVG